MTLKYMHLFTKHLLTHTRLNQVTVQCRSKFTLDVKDVQQRFTHVLWIIFTSARFKVYKIEE